ncbi:hypothetical protein B0H13DRAFT_1649979 [Mycena leptocephala]|nr:hypothetical protein B0H13DRAFT_1649979 [Mycena leptocephala]
MDRQAAIFEIAWVYQKRPKFRFADIDHECLNIFEERLFEQSFQAGRAGNHQWGLDVGPHQDNWNPCANIPEHSMTGMTRVNLNFRSVSSSSV